MSVSVVPYSREDDHVFFTPFEPVNRTNFDLLEFIILFFQYGLESGEILGIGFEETVQEGDLSEVRRDDTNIAAFHVLYDTRDAE